MPVTAASGSRLSTSSPSGDLGGRAYVQLASHRGQAEAESAFQQLQTTYPSILGRRKVVIRSADLGTKGVFYRTQIGPLSAERAEQVCHDLKAAGAQCVLQRN